MDSEDQLVQEDQAVPDFRSDEWRRLWVERTHTALLKEGAKIMDYYEIEQFGKRDVQHFNGHFNTRGQVSSFLVRNGLIEEFRADMLNEYLINAEISYKYQSGYQHLRNIAKIDWGMSIPKRPRRSAENAESYKNIKPITRFDYQVLETRIEKLEGDLESLVSKLGEYFSKLEHLRARGTNE